MYLQKDSNNSQAVFFCHSLLKQTVLVGVPVDQMELKTDAIIRMCLRRFTQILTKSTMIQFAKQDQYRNNKANAVAFNYNIATKTTSPYLHLDN